MLFTRNIQFSKDQNDAQSQSSETASYNIDAGVVSAAFLWLQACDAPGVHMEPTLDQEESIIIHYQQGCKEQAPLTTRWFLTGFSKNILNVL